MKTCGAQNTKKRRFGATVLTVLASLLRTGHNLWSRVECGPVCGSDRRWGSEIHHRQDTSPGLAVPHTSRIIFVVATMHTDVYGVSTGVYATCWSICIKRSARRGPEPGLEVHPRHRAIAPIRVPSPCAVLLRPQCQLITTYLDHFEHLPSTLATVETHQIVPEPGEAAASMPRPVIRTRHATDHRLTFEGQRFSKPAAGRKRKRLAWPKNQHISFVLLEGMGP